MVLFVLAVFITLAIVFAVLFAGYQTAEPTNRLPNTHNTPVSSSPESSNKALISPVIPTTNPFDRFDMVYYINLDARPDRRAQIEKELDRFGIRKRTRVPGVVAEFGQLGCAMAHLNALTDCAKNGYGSCLIFEDDFQFSNADVRGALERFWSVPLRWDVVMLAGVMEKFRPTLLDTLIRITSAQTTSGYAVNGAFVETLIENVRGAIHKLQTLDRSYCIDVEWKSLQTHSHWYAFFPVLGYQRASFSDIEGCDVSYIDRFNVSVENNRAIACLQIGSPTIQTIECVEVRHDPTQTVDFVYDMKDERVKITIASTTSPAHAFAVVSSAIILLCKTSARLSGHLESVFFGNATLPAGYSAYAASKLDSAYWGLVDVEPRILAPGDLYDMQRLRIENPTLAVELSSKTGSSDAVSLRVWDGEFGASMDLLRSAVANIRPLPSDYVNLRHFESDEIHWFADVCVARLALTMKKK